MDQTTVALKELLTQEFGKEPTPEQLQNVADSIRNNLTPAAVADMLVEIGDFLEEQFKKEGEVFKERNLSERWMLAVREAYTLGFLNGSEVCRQAVVETITEIMDGYTDV